MKGSGLKSTLRSTDQIMGGSASNSAGVRSAGTDMSTNVLAPAAVVALQGNLNLGHSLKRMLWEGLLVVSPTN
jgi:hypothetical protein